MCGIFGFISHAGAPPSLKTLAKIARVTETRGRHAFGMAWIDQHGLATFKRQGAATDKLDDLELVAGAEAFIAHCRWATHGSWERHCNNHPHAAGRGWIVHNGVVHNYAELDRRHALRRTTECDSETLGRLIAKQPGKLLQRTYNTVISTDGRLALLGLWAAPTRLVVARNGNPLHHASTPEGIYFASLLTDLPSSPKQFIDGSVAQLTRDRDGALSCQTQRLLALN